MFSLVFGKSPLYLPFHIESWKLDLSLIFLITVLCTSCISTVNAHRIHVAQETEGYFSDYLYYKGSTEEYHYLNQKRHAFWGGFLSSKIKCFRVPIDHLKVNKGILFPYICNSEKSIRARIEESDGGYILEKRTSGYKKAKERMKSLKKKYNKERGRIQERSAEIDE